MSAAALKVPTIFTAVDRFTGPVLAMQKRLEAFSKSSPTMQVFNTIGKGADNAFNKIVNLRNAFAIAFAGAFVKKLYDTAIGVAEVGDKAQKTGLVIGMTAEQFQELDYAAKKEGLTTDQLVSGLEKFNKNIGDLQHGTGSLNTVLKASNPTLAKQLKHVTSNEEAFGLITAAINQTPSAFEKARIAQAAFGKGGQSLLKLIAKGPAGIAELRAEARKYGIISNEAAERSDEFLDAQTEMQAAIKGVTMQLGMALMPRIQELMQKLSAWIGNNKELIRQKIAQFVDKLVSGLDFLIANFDAIVFWTKAFIIALVALKAISIISTAVTYGMTVGMLAYEAAVAYAEAAQWLFNTALSANPIGFIIIAIAALIALIYVMIKYWNEWGAALSMVTGQIGIIVGMIQTFRRNWEGIKQAFTDGGILAGIKAIGMTILDMLLMPMQQLAQLVYDFTGMDVAAQAVKNIEAFRKGLGVNVTTDESGNPLKAVNPEAAKQDALTEKINTNNTNKNVTVEFKNAPDGTMIKGDTGFNMLIPQVSSTMAF